MAPPTFFASLRSLRRATRRQMRRFLPPIIMSKIPRRLAVALAAILAAAPSAPGAGPPSGERSVPDRLRTIEDLVPTGDAAAARAEIDRLLASIGGAEYDAAAPRLALLRAASEGLAGRAEAMLEVARAFPSREEGEIAVVA